MFKRRIFSMMVIVAVLMFTLSFGASAMAASTEKMPASGSVELTNEEVTQFTQEEISEPQQEEISEPQQEEILERALTYLGRGTINADGVHLRAGPGSSYTSLGLLYQGDSVIMYVEGTTSTWFHVYSYRHDCLGYVYRSYVDRD